MDSVDTTLHQRLDVMVEVKTLSVNGTSYPNRSMGNWAYQEEQNRVGVGRIVREVECKAREVRRNYFQRAQAMDVLYSEGGKHFERALESFSSRGVTPVIAGAFNEFNHDLDRLIGALADHACSNASDDFLPFGLSRAQKKDFFRNEYRRSIAMGAIRSAAAYKLRIVTFAGNDVAAANRQTENVRRFANRRRKPYGATIYYTNRSDEAVGLRHQAYLASHGPFRRL